MEFTIRLSHTSAGLETDRTGEGSKKDRKKITVNADRLAQLVEYRTTVRAGGRGFKPRPDQHSGSLNN